MEFQLVQNCAAHENAAFLQVVSCCNARMLWRCNAGMLVEMECRDTSENAMLGCL